MMFQLGSKLSAFLSCRWLALARGTVTAGLTAVSHPNVLDSGDPETVQIFTSIHEERRMCLAFVTAPSGPLVRCRYRYYSSTINISTGSIGLAGREEVFYCVRL